MNVEPLMTADEVAALLRVSASTLYKWADPSHPAFLPSVEIAPGMRRWRREVILERMGWTDDESDGTLAPVVEMRGRR